jgi:DNA polymerase III alpha subunit (gram-positive type)
MKGDIVIFDTETTGLLAPSVSDINMQPYITEFYGVRISPDWDVVGEFESFIKPPVPIPEIVTKITGITDDMVANAPTFIEVYDDLVELYFGARTLVAHNAPFDVGVINWQLVRHGLERKFPWPPQHHCTIELSHPIKNKPLKLSVLHEIATGNPHFEGAHRAKHDVMATVRCYKWLLEQGFIK